MSDFCPNCGYSTKVVESRSQLNHKRRRRECLNKACKHRFSTWETLKNPLDLQLEDFATQLENLHHDSIALEKRIHRLLSEAYPHKFPAPTESKIIKPNTCTTNNSGIEL